MPVFVNLFSFVLLSKQWIYDMAAKRIQQNDDKKSFDTNGVTTIYNLGKAGRESVEQ